MRFSSLFAAAAVMLLAQGSVPAWAGLIANPPNTVSALFFFGAQIVGDEENEGTMTIGAAGADFPLGVSDEATIHVGDTQIAITNQASGMPFCSTSSPSCSDAFDGFEFQFSAAVDITGVSVDAASAADFGPNATAPHMGLQLVSPTEILVDVTGDNPISGDQLILDLSFASTKPPAVPEPASIALLGAGLAGLWAARARRRARRG